jgi:Cd2+/Zn2+-exporting ATPase
MSEPTHPAGSTNDSCCSHEHHNETDADGHDHKAGVSRSQVTLVAIAGSAIGAGFILNWLVSGSPALSLACFVLATAAGGILVLPHALSSLRRMRLDMNVLMTVAVAGAWWLGEGAEGATVVFLFSFAELLETWSVGKARGAVKSLLALTSETASRKSAVGSVEEVPNAEVKIGEILVVKSGQRVPLDGEVTAGQSAINQAPITGESVPVEKTVGSPVFAGTINGEGSIEMRVTKIAGDSTVAKIVKLVSEAEEQKAPTQRFVDRFAVIYTPAVFGLALLVALVPPLAFGGAWAAWLYRALVLLVIACPCALVIATPVSIVTGLTALAKRGVLVKGGAFLEAVGKLRALAVDKTGTITQGTPRVTGIIPYGQRTEEEVLKVAASIDTHSTHPLAQAVVAATKERKIEFVPADEYKSRTGQGAEASIAGHRHFIGNHRLTHELGACTPEIEKQLSELEERGESVAVVGHSPHEGCVAEVIGIISIGDTMRPEVPDALRRLHDAGLEKVVMLSGDNQRTASAIAKKAGIDDAQGDLMPEQKVERVKAMMAEYKQVGMIGDGVNDAPALATASVGIAMGAIGSDTAIETADIALMNDDLGRLADAIFVGRRTLRIIRFNVGFAVAVKAIFLVLAFTGHTSLWLAILADTGATLLVVANALRLLRYKPA